MGTRGLIGYYKKGVTKASYNHYDSYPSFLGNRIKEYITDSDAISLNADFAGIRFVDEDAEVLPEHIIAIFNFWYGDVEKVEPDPYGRPEDELPAKYWYRSMYDLLSCSHTDIRRIAKSGMMIDYIDFIKGSLFCEWAYIINLDRGVLEIYRGYQTKKPKKNRYALSKEEIAERRAETKLRGRGEWHTQTNMSTGKTRRVFHKNETYYNCDLIAEIPIEIIPEFDMDVFGELVKRTENITDKSCGNVLIPDQDFAPEVIRSTTFPFVARVFGLYKEYIEPETEY